MFKYIWLIVLIILWSLWGYLTLKDCIKLKKRGFNDVYEFINNLKTESFAFILTTLLVVISFSFYAWIISLMGE